MNLEIIHCRVRLVESWEFITASDGKQVAKTTDKASELVSSACMRQHHVIEI